MICLHSIGRKHGTCPFLLGSLKSRALKEELGYLAESHCVTGEGGATLCIILKPVQTYLNQNWEGNIRMKGNCPEEVSPPGQPEPQQNGDGLPLRSCNSDGEKRRRAEERKALTYNCT